jgi:uncharacterized protein YkwD
MVFAAGFALFALAPVASAAPRPSSEASLLQAVNATRASYGLRPLAADGTLTRAARAHSRAMIAERSFSHGAFARRLASFGARGPIVGENLAWGVGALAQAKAIVQMWLRSPEHRANLLRPGFSRVGLGLGSGTFQGHTGATVVTADFAGR